MIDNDELNIIAEKLSLFYGFEKNDLEYNTYLNDKGERVKVENLSDLFGDIFSKKIKHCSTTAYNKKLSEMKQR